MNREIKLLIIWTAKLTRGVKKQNTKKNLLKFLKGIKEI
jgi:hypothetical protein